MSSCLRQSSKKYYSRDSPAFPANKCQGQTKRGNDGKMYRSKANKNGVYRWVAATQKSGGGSVRQHGPRQLNENCSTARKCAKGLQCKLRFRKNSEPGEYGQLKCVEAPQPQQRSITPNLDLARALQLIHHNVDLNTYIPTRSATRRTTKSRDQHYI